jgi:hypothetical protein
MLNSVTVTCEIENFTLKNQPVKNRGGDNGVSEEVCPVVKALVRCKVLLLTHNVQK